MKNYSYQISTDNINFIEMYENLKNKNINNNKFFLKIYDKELAEINPLYEKLSIELKTRVLNEITINPFYYFREILRLPESGGYTKFQLNNGTLAMLYCALNNINTIVILPRQNKKTITTIALIDWIYNFSTINTDILFGNKVFDDSKLNISRYKAIHKLLPSYIKQFDKNDDDNIERITKKSLNNSIQALSSPVSIEQANKLGRGLTSPILFWDEVAFVKFFSAVYASASPVLSKASESAKKNKKPYFKLFATTPNYLEDPTAKYIKEMIDMAAVWDESLYDFSKADLDNYVRENSRNDFMYIKYNRVELGLSDEWYENQCRSLNWNAADIQREVDIEWSYASSSSPFTEESLKFIKENLKEPIYYKVINKTYKFSVYKEIKEDYPYAIGIDIGGGLSIDNTVVNIIDPKTLVSHAIFKSPKISTTKLKILLKIILTEWLKEAFIIPERNNYGLPIITDLLEQEEYFSIRNRIFYFYKEFETATKTGIKNINELGFDHRKEKTRIYGVNTTGNSREEMFDFLSDDIVENPQFFFNDLAYSDLTTLERNKKNKIEHRYGEHDDVILSWLLVRYASQQTTFKKFFKTFLDKKKNNIVADKIKKILTGEEVYQFEPKKNYTSRLGEMISDLNKR